jgi:SRSO17 transposase
VRLPEEVVAAKEAGAPQYRGRGQPPKERPAPLYTAEEVIGSLPDEAWQTVSWREGTKGALGKRMVALRAHRATGSDRHSTTHERVLTAQEGWLIAERPLRPAEGEDLPDEEEQKYYYSSLEAGVSLERLAALAKSRWAIEQFYEDAKGECGLGDYQGRRWERATPSSGVGDGGLQLPDDPLFGPRQGPSSRGGGGGGGGLFPPLQRSGTRRCQRFTGRY